MAPATVVETPAQGCLLLLNVGVVLVEVPSAILTLPFFIHKIINMHFYAVA
jgi:hypothetical protein